MEIRGSTDALSALGALDDARGRAAERSLRGKDAEAGHAFESFFAQMFVREMRRGLPEGFFGGAGADVYSSWLDEHLGESLAKDDALGIAGMVRAALGRQRAADERADAEAGQSVDGASGGPR
jgi:Rod binding domain-containing protein